MEQNKTKKTHEKYFLSTMCILFQEMKWSNIHPSHKDLPVFKEVIESILHIGFSLIGSEHKHFLEKSLNDEKDVYKTKKIWKFIINLLEIY